MLDNITSKMAQMEHSSPTAMAGYVSFAQETKCKAEELAQQRTSEESEKA